MHCLQKRFDQRDAAIGPSPQSLSPPARYYADYEHGGMALAFVRDESNGVVQAYYR